MPTWKSRGLRGSLLEEMINMTNEKYRESGLALIQKVPTPITPITIDKQTRHITLAYFEQKSTVDYIGAVQGIPVCFDAKECAVDLFMLQKIHPHHGQFQDKSRKKTKRYGITPHIDGVADKAEPTVSARPENTRNQRRIDGCSHDVIGIDEQHIFQIVHGLFRQSRVF